MWRKPLATMAEGIYNLMSYELSLKLRDSYEL